MARLPEGFPKECPICGAKWRNPFYHLLHYHPKIDIAKAFIRALGWKGRFWL